MKNFLIFIVLVFLYLLVVLGFSYYKVLSEIPQNEFDKYLKLTFDRYKRLTNV